MLMINRVPELCSESICDNEIVRRHVLYHRDKTRTVNSVFLPVSLSYNRLRYKYSSFRRGRSGGQKGSTANKWDLMSQEVITR